MITDNGYGRYFGDSTGVETDVNITPMRNAYPSAPGGTLATLAQASSPDSFNPNRPAMNQAAVATATPRGGVAWWVGIVLLVGLMLFAARKTGNADEFKNVRASTYNVLFVTLVAIVGITAAKVLAVQMRRFGPLAGLSDVILAA